MRPRVKAIYQGARVGYCSRAGGRDMCSLQPSGAAGEGEGGGAEKGKGSEGAEKGKGRQQGGRGRGR